MLRIGRSSAASPRWCHADLLHHLAKMARSCGWQIGVVLIVRAQGEALHLALRRRPCSAVWAAGRGPSMRRRPPPPQAAAPWYAGNPAPRAGTPRVISSPLAANPDRRSLVLTPWNADRPAPASWSTCSGQCWSRTVAATWAAYYAWDRFIYEITARPGHTLLTAEQHDATS